MHSSLSQKLRRGRPRLGRIPFFFEHGAKLRVTVSIIFIGLILFQVNYVLPPATHANSSTYSVTIVDYAFQPLHINIITGTTVTWTYSGSGRTIHTVTSDPGTNQTQGGAPLLSSGDLNPGQSFSYTFDLPGYYPYQCAVHPTIATMNGWVNVTGNPVAPPSSGPPNGSSFPWLPAGIGIAGVTVAAILIAWTLVRRRTVPKPGVP